MEEGRLNMKTLFIFVGSLFKLYIWRLFSNLLDGNELSICISDRMIELNFNGELDIMPVEDMRRK